MNEKRKQKKGEGKRERGKPEDGSSKKKKRLNGGEEGERGRRQKSL